MNEKYTFEFIEEYLAGNLSTEESQAFEKAVESDKQLATELDSQKAAHKAVALYTQVKTREKVGELYAKVKGQGQAKVRRLGPMALAATVVFLVFMGLAYFFIYNSYSGSSLMASNLEQYPDRISSMSDTPGTDMTNAMSAYNKKDFETAIPLFTNILPDNKYYHLAQLYLGISQLKTNMPGDAVTTLQDLYSTDTEVKEPALWYLALAQLAHGDEATAKINLEKIVSEGGYQAAKAEQLLKKLNSKWRTLPGLE